jgi:uncharacterized damage-inducible protein DinB
MDQDLEQSFTSAREAQKKSLHALEEEIRAARAIVRAANFSSMRQEAEAHILYGDRLMKKVMLEEHLNQP